MFMCSNGFNNRDFVLIITFFDFWYVRFVYCAFEVIYRFDFCEKRFWGNFESQVKARVKCAVRDWSRFAIQQNGPFSFSYISCIC